MEARTFAQIIILKAIKKKTCDLSFQSFGLYQEADGWSSDWDEGHSDYGDYNDCSSPSPYDDSD